MLRLLAIGSILLGMGLCPTFASASPSDPDPWFGEDKMLHFGVSAALASGGYAAASLIWEEPEERLLAGAGLALGLGAAKEVADLAGYGDPSWRDMTWNVAGTGVGLVLAWAVDRLLVRESAASSSVTAGSLAFRF